MSRSWHPAAPLKGADPEAMPVDAIVRALPTMRALVIDDMQSNLDHMLRVIGEVGDLECHGYSDPVAAIAAAGTTAFDLIVVDYVMPTLNGLDVIRHLREQPKHRTVPIVMVTGRVSEDVRLAAIETGATDFLSKSVGRTELKARLRNLVQLSAAFHWMNSQASLLEHALRAATRKLLEREEEMILRLSRAVEYRDNDTGGHTSGSRCTVGSSRRNLDFHPIRAGRFISPRRCTTWGRWRSRTWFCESRVASIPRSSP